MRRGRNRNGREGEIAKGLVSGAVGGLIASWTMNKFMQVSAKATQALQPRRHDQGDAAASSTATQSEQQSQPQPQQQQSAEDSEDATMKAANKLYKAVRHRELSPEQKKKAGPVVHYAYGTLVGGLYGALAEVTRKPKLGVGTGYATVLWAVGDEVAVPLLGLSKSPTEYPLSSHANALAAHLVYGITTEMVRRSVRRVW